MGLGDSSVVDQRGFVLVVTLVFLALCAVIALEAFNRAQLDMRLAAHGVASSRAHMAANGLIQALVADQSAALDAGLIPDDSIVVCPTRGPCSGNYPRVARLREQLPDGLSAQVTLARVDDVLPARLPEVRSSSVRLYTRNTFEGRVHVSGSATSTLASQLLVTGLPAGMEEGRP